MILEDKNFGPVNENVIFVYKIFCRLCGFCVIYLSLYREIPLSCPTSQT